jgi:hypothetical protein
LSDAKPVVLVVDDEPGVRLLLELVLKQSGLAVRAAAGGAEAVDLYRRHAAEIAAVLLDVMMPGLNGPATLAALREANPNVRCFFTSGAADGPQAEELQRLGPAGVFPKPFALTEVTRAVWTCVRPSRA